MENVRVMPANDAAAIEARRAKYREYNAKYRATHPEVVKAAKQRWHEKARETETARRAEIYRRAREDPAYVERRRAESRAYNQAHPEEVKEAKKRYKERQRVMRLVLAATPVAAGG